MKTGVNWLDHLKWNATYSPLGHQHQEVGLEDVTVGREHHLHRTHIPDVLGAPRSLSLYAKVIMRFEVGPE